MGCQCEVNDSGLCRIAPATGATAGDDRDPGFATFGNEQAFVCQAIDGIDDKIIASAEKRVGVGGSEEFHRRVRLALRIDAADSLGHDFDFGAAYVCRDCMKLTINIADADVVEINERETTHATARERFDRPRADAANPNDADMRRTQTRQPICTEKSADAAKAKIEIAHAGVIYRERGILRHSQARGLCYKKGVQAILRFTLATVALAAFNAGAQVLPKPTTNRVMETKTVPAASGAATNLSVNPTARREVALLAGGCFWGMEEILRKIPGVLETKVGYTGGSVPNPNYRLVCTGITGHAEAVQIVFDPAKITYEQVLGYFFRMHDPTTPNRQHNDVGTQYRSAIFYTTDEQKAVAERVKAAVDKGGRWKRPIVTEITKATEFYPGEDYHQKYLVKNPGGYNCHVLLPE